MIVARFLNRDGKEFRCIDCMNYDYDGDNVIILYRDTEAEDIVAKIFKGVDMTIIFQHEKDES